MPTVLDSTYKPGQTLAKVPIFSGLTESELGFLAQRTVPRHYSAGETRIWRRRALLGALCG